MDVSQIWAQYLPSFSSGNDFKFAWRQHVSALMANKRDDKSRRTKGQQSTVDMAGQPMNC